MKQITLSTAHKMRTLQDAGLTQSQIADKLGVDQATVSRTLAGKGLIRQRAIADRMEAFVGGVLLGNGNLRFHAESPSEDNDEGHDHRISNHPLGDTWDDNDQRVLPVVDTLTLLLSEEDLISKLQAAGINPDEVMIVDHESDVEEGTQTEGSRVSRTTEVHSETYDEFVARAERDMKPGGNLQALMCKRLETEGQDVNVWAVRDPAFMGWPQTTWHPGLTNDTHYTKRVRT